MIEGVQVLSADEVAEKLKLTKRAIIKLAKAHGLCAQHGRTFLFSEADVPALFEAMRVAAVVPTLRASGPYRPTPSSDKAMQSLRKMAAERRKKFEERKAAARAENEKERAAVKKAGK